MDKGKGIVLIVDDEADMRQLVRMYLEKEGFLCLEAEDGEEALNLVKAHTIDLIILDVMMPKVDGLTFCMKVREQSSVPIIFLTARGDEWDRVYGLKLGADDYIVKPFSPNELVARVDAVLRRANPAVRNKEDHISYGPIEINLKGRQAFLNGELLNLTLKEYEILLFFCRHHGQALSREQLLENVWGFDYVGGVRTVDTHIKTLRLKLKEYGNLIQTVWGIGYKFEVPQ
ncbi:response regulator transcription factor [Calidifontibacillus erzurumensis]|uniref:Response regulator transcription factor n=1 Tax=Calidifontibacillus erzurumensis TaxID=2741433 RepID=A0A8J8GH22_9BACI|nr:response regulator transcription factor [Calidifontibacillus erzurumensis]NSL51658.1 response regulator transcription factor [Calidifontibacillus erzurumensis]